MIPSQAFSMGALLRFDDNSRTRCGRQRPPKPTNGGRGLFALALLSVGLSGGCDPSGTPSEQAATRAPAHAEAPLEAASAPPTQAAPPAPAAKKGPPGPLNVLLLTIDALRSDMPWQGYDRDIAPNLTALAKQSAVYTRAYSVSSYTAKSVGALLSGTLPSTLYRNGWFFTGYSQSNHFFPEALQEHGIRTLGWHAHKYFDRDKGLEQGFDVWKVVDGITFDKTTDNHVTAPKTTALALKLLGDPKNTGGQFFAWTHFMDPHDVYIKHEGTPDFGKTNRDRYDSEIYFVDQHVGKLLAWAKDQPWWDKTAIIISSDHGEAFGEHGMFRHGFDIWEVLTRVPLLIYGPGIEPQRIDQRRSHLDIAPTIMELMGQKPLPEFRGESMVPELYGVEEPENREPIVLELAEDSHNPPRRAVISGDYKLTLYGDSYRRMLYNLAKDPGETTDLREKEPAQFTEMSKLFDDTFAGIPSVKPFGGMKLRSGKIANGPINPPGYKKPKPASSDEASGG